MIKAGAEDTTDAYSSTDANRHTYGDNKQSCTSNEPKSRSARSPDSAESHSHRLRLCRVTEQRSEVDESCARYGVCETAHGGNLNKAIEVAALVLIRGHGWR